MAILQTLDLRLLNLNPLIATLDDFLSADDCQALVQAASGNLKRSKVINAESENIESDHRTNSNAYVSKDQTPVVTRMLMLLSLCLKLPATHAEQLQVLHYEPGQEFKPHHDGLAVDGTDTQRAQFAKNGGQRLFSTMVYLNDVTAGGGTDFPNLKLSVAPQKGRLLIFANTGAGNSFMSNLSLHAGTPVEKGEKWSAITWWREKPLPEGDRGI